MERRLPTKYQLQNLNDMLHKIAFFALIIVLGLLISDCQQNPYAQGKIMYENFCEACHGADGKGLKGLVPPLAQADYLLKNKNKIACIIRHGMEGEITVNGKVYDQPMGAIPQLSDFEITNIINHINHAWGHDYGYYQINEVKADLENCEKNNK